MMGLRRYAAADDVIDDRSRHKAAHNAKSNDGGEMRSNFHRFNLSVNFVNLFFFSLSIQSHLLHYS